MNRALRSTALTLAALGALTACSTGGGTTADTTSSSASSAVDSSSNQGTAPKVSAALPTVQLTANPCSALSEGQLSQLGMAAVGKQSQNDAGPVCSWRGATDDANVAFVNPITANRNGLSDIYANNAAGKYAYFVPVTIAGYPAVEAEPTDARASGSCTVDVAVTDQLAVDVAVQLLKGPNVTKSCDSANKIATAMIEHLKGAA